MHAANPPRSERGRWLHHFHRFQATGNGSGDLGLHAQQRADQEHEPGQPSRAAGRSTPGCLAAAAEQKLKPAKVIGSLFLGQLRQLT